ncbi:MAG: hypothetical protein DCF31_15040 [Alphaproteobacteria bacterium]|nr:MAG: hypothetical protein DCF31_15040 [Alphaproteobacteria bacterium]
MAEAILDAIGPALVRWTMGGAAAPLAPAAWATALGTDPADAELRLLALSGHFLGSFVVPMASGALVDRADLPRLALPTVPARPRPLLRRLLNGAQSGRQRQVIAAFVAARGWTLHPADWLPGANDDALPDVYAPWLDWAASDAGRQASGGALTAESWDDFGPAARALLLVEMRRRDPAAARELIAARLAGTDAEGRLRLVLALATGLGSDDRPLFEALAADRAPRVKAQAAALLARLGVGGDDATEAAAELAGYFDVQTKGLLRRTRVVVAQPLKTAAQVQRRAQLLQGGDFAALAAALALAPVDLATLWVFGSNAALDAGFAGLAERSAGDDVVDILCTALAGTAAGDPVVMQALRPRLAPAQCRALAAAVLRTRGAGALTAALDIAGPDPRFDDLVGTTAFAEIHKAVADSERPTPAAIPELWALGWLASPAAARAVRDRLVAAGLAAADPRLDSIRLNIMLDEGGSS